MLDRVRTFVLAALVLAPTAACGQEPPPPAPPQTPSQPPSEGWLAVPEVAERAVRSVVHVSSERVVPGPSLEPFGPWLDDPRLREFFGPHPGVPEPPDLRRRGLGSGVIVDPAGIVLTNAHVVEGADRIEVGLPGHRGSWSAEVVGADAKSDLAVLRLVDPPDDLVALPFGDSDALRLGEPVLAVGNPYGVGQTVTMGIVSATDRSDLGIVDLEDFIQTDAAINPGNSGGPLVNLRGEIVGINTAILSGTGGGNVGIGFAVPSAMARPILASILEDGTVERGWLGVALQALDAELSAALGLPPEQPGVLVAEVLPGGPADEAGVEAGDVIVGFQGEPVGSSSELRNRVASAGAVPFRLDVVREGAGRTLEGRLGRVDEERPVAEAPKAAETRGAGMGLTSLTEELRAGLGIPPQVEGVLVTEVRRGSAAALAGLRAGDVIVEIDQRPVADPRDAGKRLERHPPVLLRVWSPEGTRYVAFGEEPASG